MDMKPRNHKNKRHTVIAWVMAVLMLAAIIPVNLIAEQLEFNLDLTPNQLYTLTDTTTSYLDTVDKDVTIHLLMNLDELKDDPDSLALYKALQQYEAYDCITIDDFDPDTNPEKLKALNPNDFFKLSQGDFLVECGDMVKRVPGKTMYTYSYEEDESGNITTTGARFNGENYLTGAIKAVVDGVMPTIYFLTGHGEKSVEEYGQFKVNLANYNYQMDSLNLASADKVPEDAGVIILAAPQRDISEGELEKLNAYLDEGGNISFLMSPNSEKIRYTNIESILEDYCWSMDYNRIHETDTSLHVSGDPYTFMTQISPPIEADGYPDLTSGLLENNQFIPYMPASRSFFSIDGVNRTKLIMDTLMTTYNTAVGEPYGGTQEDVDPITGQEQVLSAYSMDTTRNNSKIVLMGNAEFLDDENVSSAYVMIPVYLYLSTLTWMHNSDVDMQIANKEKTYDYMLLNNEAAANRVQIFFILIPLLIASIGVIGWIRRQRT